MARHTVYRLTNTLQEYAWGSQHAIFDAFGWQPSGRPAAELWLGAHESAPSVARCIAQVPPTWRDAVPASVRVGPDASGVALGDLIASDPHFMVGENVADVFGPRLPYLLKVLAAAGPLSLQVHPKPHQARAGFARENRAGVDRLAPERLYKDDQHKPELIVALTPFEGLSGFRRPQRAGELLEPVQGPTVQAMREVLAGPGLSDDRLRAAFELAAGLRDTDALEELTVATESLQRFVDAERGAGRRVSRGHVTALELAKAYPGDPGMLMSLLLNRFSLQPGEAVFLRAGQIHAYLHGLGVEIMANSDNVLRAGLTTKHVDVPELMACTDFTAEPPVRPSLRPVPGGLTDYRVGTPEFGLVYGDAAHGALITHTGPRIVVCLNGSVTISHALGELGTLTAGQSAFVPHGVGSVALSGGGSVAVSYVP